MLNLQDIVIKNKDKPLGVVTVTVEGPHETLTLLVPDSLKTIIKINPHWAFINATPERYLPRIENFSCEDVEHLVEFFGVCDDSKALIADTLEFICREKLEAYLVLDVNKQDKG